MSSNDDPLSAFGIAFISMDMAAQEKKSWTRRLSYTPIPRPTLASLPSVSRLRAALLGYVGELENVLEQSRPSSPHNAEELNSPSTSSGSDSSALSTSLQSHADELRKRPGPVVDPTRQSSLQALREEISRHLPGTPQLPRVEWLRTLPQRLSVLERGVPSLESGKGKAKWEGPDLGSIQMARHRVIELVHAALPSEQWAGWERLGWETEDGQPSRTLDTDPSQDSEPEYMFPNRTPASAKVQPAKQTIRSRSMSLHDAWSPLAHMPMLQRTRTEPLHGSALVTSPIDLEEEDEDEDKVWDEDLTLEEQEVAVADAQDEVVVRETKIQRLRRARSSSAIGPSVVEALQRSQEGKMLIQYDDLPYIWRNNEHIHKGYRFIPLKTDTGPVPLLKSAFAWHNETVNIHSHLIPTLMILAFIPIIVYSSPLPNAHPLDTATLVVYFLAAASCLVSSAGWHVLSGCASRKWFEWGACVDYIGISWLIAASFFTVLYNAFYCNPKTVLFYSSINLICGVLGSVLPFQEWFNKRRNKPWRIAFFLFLCFAMVAPMGQLFYQHGYRKGKIFVAPFANSVYVYVTGLLFYGFHFPECYWPGRFDHMGQSHQIWHAAIVLAVILHYQAVFSAHSLRHAYSCAVPDAGQPVGELVEEWYLSLVAGLSGLWS